jgi:hypothetical protein
MESNCGIYLKWFNANGGYSYWLFDKFYSDTTSTKTIDEIVGKYDNLKNVNSFSTITGKKLMQPIKYKHVLMCFIKNISQVHHHLLKCMYIKHHSIKSM